ncbi:efflux RND transporter periplasmic adaptor subunit [Acidihalobacter prosperus]
MASRKTRLARRIIFMLVFVAVIYGGVIGFNRFMGAKILEAMASAPPPTVTVSVAQAKQQTWSNELQAVATLKAKQGTTLTSESSGAITGLHFKSGETVKKGQLLVQINDNVARAQLDADQAKLLNAKQEIERQRKLFARQATSQASLQSAEAAYREAQAAVQADRATLANLQVRAPFTGHLGLRNVSLGQYVSPGTDIVDIQQWNPLRVTFNLPQRDLSKVAIGDAVDLSIDGLASKTFTGQITAFGSAVENSTRTIAIQAEVKNGKNELRPGMFGQATIRLAASTKVIAVPATAITYNTYGEYVYVIKDNGKGKVAEQRNVQTGIARNGMIAITRGVKPGESVVVAGQVNLYPGARVKVTPAPKGISSPDTAASRN